MIASAARAPAVHVGPSMLPVAKAVVAVAVVVVVVMAGGLPEPARGMGGGAADAGGEFARDPSWSLPQAEAIRRRVFTWLEEAGDADRDSVAARAAEIWTAADGVAFDPLDAVLETLALVDPRVPLVREAAVRGSNLAAATAWNDEPAVAELERDAVKLWLGRQLVGEGRFDEALPLLTDLDVATAVDPAALLFHRAACQHWLLQSEAAIASLDRLLERADEIPVRYERVARLLRADMESLEDESLDHIARRMRDITRRLSLGRAGTATREVQDGVVESLDALIKKLEDEQQGQQQQQAAGGGGAAGKGGAGQPMEDSRIAGGQGKGEVRGREFGAADGWGSLSPHEREEALQQIGREFPPHYREAIEQYFKRLAAGKEDR